MRRGLVGFAAVCLGAAGLSSQGREPLAEPVSFPQVVSSVRGTYTPEATAAKIHAWVSVAAVVLPDGTVGEAKVSESCFGHIGDSDEANRMPFRCVRPGQEVSPSIRVNDRLIDGLEEEALNAARRWLFKPGVKDGKPAPVGVVIEIEFERKTPQK